MVQAKRHGLREAWLLRKHLGIFTAIIFSVILLPEFMSAVLANGSRPDALQNVGFDQKLNEQVPLGLVFRDEDGRAVKLGEYFGNKPVIVTFMYYECPNLCPLVLNGIIRSLKALSFNVGDQFNVLTVSIDPGEGPALAMAKKRESVQRYGRPGAEDGWHFLTGEENSIKSLTQAVGFRYAYDAENDQYAHASGIIVLTPQGRISRYFYGIEYAPRDLRLGLVEASSGKIGSPVDQLLLFCYQYDAATGKYTLAIMNTLRLAALATVLALSAFVVVMVKRERVGAKTEKEGLENV
jgi:protein SCO1/2